MGRKQIKGMRSRKKKSHIGAKVLVVLLILAILSIGVIYSIYAANRMDISDYEYQAKDKNVTIDQIPVDLQQALISVEDSRFYDHFDIDVFGIIRAFFANIANGVWEKVPVPLPNSLPEYYFCRILTQSKLLVSHLSEN